MFCEGVLYGFLYIRGFHDSLVRSFRRIMAFDGFRADSVFGDELYGGAEEVMEEPPFLGVEIIQGCDDARVM